MSKKSIDEIITEVQNEASSNLEDMYKNWSIVEFSPLHAISYSMMTLTMAKIKQEYPEEFNKINNKLHKNKLTKIN
jgi:DNA polymerase III alpha subunit